MVVHFMVGGLERKVASEQEAQVRVGSKAIVVWNPLVE